MDRETKKWLTIGSILIAIAVILLLWMFGFDISNIKVYKGIKFNIN